MFDSSKGVERIDIEMKYSALLEINSDSEFQEKKVQFAKKNLIFYLFVDCL